MKIKNKKNKKPLGWTSKLPCQDSRAEDKWSKRHLEGASMNRINRSSSSSVQELAPVVSCYPSQISAISSLDSL